jgi:hypothetical protein
MAFAGPINASSQLNLLTAVRLRFMDAYSSAYGGPEYSDWQKFTWLEDPAGDLIYSIYAEPLKPLRQWLGERPASQVDFRFWTQAVRTFADSMEVDVDDIKDDANPAKRMMYMAAAQRLADASVGLWPSLVAETLVKGTTSIWLPDGQQIFSTHNYNINNASLGTFRNYNANSSQGGNAAWPLTYGNLLTSLKAGYTFKAPTGLDYPIYYSHLVVPPGSIKTAKRLLSFDSLPSFEAGAGGTTGAGGNFPNEIKQSFGDLQVCALANMPPNTWALIDARTPSEMPLGLKQREPITWQYIGPTATDATGFPVSDAGQVPEMVFNRNKQKMGPKARGDGFFRNWWRVFLADGNASPVTTLSIVS